MMLFCSTLGNSVPFKKVPDEAELLAFWVPMLIILGALFSVCAINYAQKAHVMTLPMLACLPPAHADQGKGHRRLPLAVGPGHPECITLGHGLPLMLP